ncbi:MAG: AmmeMemoRadiSam system protein B [Desulfobacteraceae bacterium]
MTVRTSDFAGAWYPGSAAECRRLISSYVEAARPCPEGKKLVGGIVPHAGWVFSGHIACNIIQCLAAVSDPDTVVIFGRHLHPRSGNYIMTEGSWATPLGDLVIDNDLAEGLVSEFRFTVETAAAHDQDNTIELQLPFIRYFFPQAKILPVGVPPAPESLGIGARTVDIAKELGRDVLVLGSTDLTHYGYNFGFAPKGVGSEAVSWVKNYNDRRVIDLMLAMDAEGVIAEGLEHQNACCAGAAAAAVAAAKRLGADRGVELAYATSYDIRPDTSFVGYVGILF